MHLAAIAMATDHTPVVAATSEPDIGEHIAKLQAAAGGGPTWQAVRTATTVHVPDLITETRDDEVSDIFALEVTEAEEGFALRVSTDFDSIELQLRRPA
jgi:hypothetical protein